MKKIIVMATLVLLGKAFAASPDDVNLTKYDFEKWEKAYTISLKYDNLGVVESAIYCVVRLKYAFPNTHFRMLNEMVYALSLTGKTHQIRYKANIASLYMNNPELMDRLNEEDLQDGPDLWAMLVKNIYPIPITI